MARLELTPVDYDPFGDAMRLAMADLPPPPSDPAFKRPADPLRPQPLKRGGVSGTGSGMKYGTPTPPPEFGSVKSWPVVPSEPIRPPAPPPSVKDWAPVPSDPKAFAGAAERRRRGVPEDLRKERHAMDPEDMDILRAMVERGMTLPQIAKAFGIGPKSISKNIKSMREKGDVHMPEKLQPVGEPSRLKPSMPQFDFKDPLSKDNFQDYIKALEKHMNDVKAYFNVNGANVASLNLTPVDHDPFEG